VTVLEVAIAALFVLAGIRSLITWSGRRFEAVDVADHALYALYLTGRVGLWFAFAGFFAIYAWVDASGQSLRRYQWYLIVPLVLAAMQLVGGWFLGHRSPGAGPPPRAASGGNGDRPR
jgi:hypothetical protein